MLFFFPFFIQKRFMLQVIFTQKDTRKFTVEVDISKSIRKSNEYSRNIPHLVFLEVSRPCFVLPRIYRYCLIERLLWGHSAWIVPISTLLFLKQFIRNNLWILKRSCHEKVAIESAPFSVITCLLLLFTCSWWGNAKQNLELIVLSKVHLVHHGFLGGEDLPWERIFAL